MSVRDVRVEGVSIKRAIKSYWSKSIRASGPLSGLGAAENDKKD